MDDKTADDLRQNDTCRKTSIVSTATAVPDDPPSEPVAIASPLLEHTCLIEGESFKLTKKETQQVR